jgi:hypothetical protein
MKTGNEKKGDRYQEAGGRKQEQKDKKMLHVANCQLQFYTFHSFYYLTTDY